LQHREIEFRVYRHDGGVQAAARITAPAWCANFHLLNIQSHRCRETIEPSACGTAGYDVMIRENVAKAGNEMQDEHSHSSATCPCVLAIVMALAVQSFDTCHHGRK